MNKFFALTLLALVASASCGVVPQDDSEFSQASADGSDVETDLLMGHERLFTYFCTDMGLKIQRDMAEFSRQTSSYITQLFFGGINDITSDVINVQKDVVAQLTAQLAQPGNEIVISDDAKLSEDQIAKLVAEGKRSIQESSAIAGVVPATKTAVAAMIAAANSALFTRLAKARAYVSGINLYKGFKSACEKVADYEEEMKATLEKEKVTMKETVEGEVRKFVEAATIESLNCFTTKNIVRLHGFCDIVQAGHSHFFKMLGMASPLEKLDH